MRLVLDFPDRADLPRVVVEDTPVACAVFIRALGETAMAVADSPVEPAPVTEPSDTPKATTRREARDEVRTYRGRINRRHMVLEALRSLAAEGQRAPRLDDIRTRFAELYPEEQRRNLDQVVRDLVNKTGHLSRSERGTYHLVGDDRVAGGLEVLDDNF